ncbi:MAG: cation-translocating P-type ATPase [Sphingomonadales bacterium]|nr:cation-translocating P-type ATPase [Sphingomonadales bacterium]
MPQPSLNPRPALPTKVDRAGLTSAEAARRLAAEGPNQLPQARRRTALRIVGEVLREPMLAMLLAAGGIYLLLGDLAEALILLAFATFSVIITAVQETRTEHVLEALRDLSAPRALVIRDGEHQRVAGSEVVRGDVLVLEAGDRIAADALLFDAQDLQCDESLLTGESLPVGKRAPEVGGPADRAVENGAQAPRPGGEDQPFVYSGSMIARGYGLAQVTATGPDTEIGKIGKSLASLDTEAPRLRKETARIVRYSAAGGGLVALLVVLLYGLTRGGWIEALLAGITISMSMLPEEFLVVLTVFMAMGAWRIGQAGVLTRRATAIETLGSTTVLCTDKTGTLTENRMAVVRLWLPAYGEATVEPDRPLPDRFAAILETSVMASAIEAVDPMEVAIHEAGQFHLNGDRADQVLTHSYGLRPDLLAMSNVWQDNGRPDKFVVAAKGAPEAIARLCRLDQAGTDELLRAADAMAQKGIRVLGVAATETSGPDRPESHSEYKFALAGLLGLADPLRPSVPDAIAQCRRAGIKVVMITGDYAVTARSIAAAAGIEDGEVITGEELDALDDAALARRLPQVSVFARIMPEQKLRIVEAFKADGEIIAMTGDGVNDAPSLKAAHIGVAMGKRGTDVAREASAIVLLEDDFGSIMQTIALGRRIYDNIRKAMEFIFAVHVPIAGLALMPLLLGQPMLLGPIHIALLEMVIDPVCALVFEAEGAEEDQMSRQPRDPAVPMFSIPMVIWGVFQGGLSFILLAGVYFAGMHLDLPETELRGLMFFSLIAAIVALILANRSYSTSLAKAFRSHNKALAMVLTAVGLVSATILLVRPVREFLKFGELNPVDCAVAAAVGFGLLLLLERLKPLAAASWSKDLHHART